MNMSNIVKVSTTYQNVMCVFGPNKCMTFWYVKCAQRVKHVNFNLRKE